MKRSKFHFPESAAVRAAQEAWRVSEVRSAIRELDAGKGVGHEEVVSWLKSWGTPRETKAPR